MFHAQAGLTLIEIMVTVAVATIVLTIAVPNYVAFTRANRLSTQVNNFVQALHLARSEAVRAGGATLCASNDQNNCTKGGDWTTGWIIFTDYNIDGAKNGDDEIVRVGDASPEGFSVETSDIKATFNRMGFLGTAGQMLSFSFCNQRVGVGMGRTVSVNPAGRAATVSYDGCK